MSAATTTPTKIAIIYYSTYGHMKVGAKQCNLPL